MLRTKRKVIISLHGIRTRGLWQKDLSPLLSEQGWTYYPLDYGSFWLLPFVLGVFRRRKIEWFRDRYQEIHSRCPDVVPSIIAHSFGSWIVCKAIQKYEHLRFDKVILAGSVVPDSFDWRTVYQRNQITTVRNDRAQKDVWARFSKFIAWGTGSSGFRGFSQREQCVVERIYPEYGHSSVFGHDHYIGEWIPFLRAPVPFSNGELPSESEEPVSPYDAARWSAITYFKQYVCRICAALIRREIHADDNATPVEDVERFVVLVPQTPGEASETAIARYYAKNGLRRVIFGGPTRRTSHVGEDGVLYDIPTTINSLLCLDHRGDKELIDAVNEFALTLQERIDAAESDAKGVVEIRRI